MAHSTPPLAVQPTATRLAWPAGSRPCGRTSDRISDHRKQRACELVAILTAAAFAIPQGEVAAATRRTPYVAFARQSAMYLAHVVLGLTYTEIGRAFGRDRTTAAHACRLIEERRDDPAVDAVLSALESACGAMCRNAGAAVRS
jgi:hypothetical protein